MFHIDTKNRKELMTNWGLVADCLIVIKEEKGRVDPKILKVLHNYTKSVFKKEGFLYYSTILFLRSLCDFRAEKFCIFV